MADVPSSRDVRRNLFALCAVENDTKVLLTGGTHGTERSLECQLLDTRTGEWTRQPDLNDFRESHSSCATSKWAFIIGGSVCHYADEA